MLPALAVASGAADHSSFDTADGSYGFSSEDCGDSSYLGVDTSDITPDRLAALHLKDERGVEVTMVDQDAPAGKAGVHEHDVILSINGDAVQGVEQLRRMIHEIPPGRSVTIGISRNGEALALKAQLAHRKDFSVLAPEFKFEMPNLTASIPEMDVPASIVVAHSSARSGLMVENLSPQLSDFFGVKDGQGILVRSVEKGSFADKSGFHAGDVIVRVNGQSVNDSGDFGQALRTRKTNTVTISIVRAKKEQTLTLTLPEIKHTGFENVGTQSIGEATRKELRGAASQIAAAKPQINLAIRQMQVMTPEIQKEVREQLEHAQEQIQQSLRECENEAKKDEVQRQKNELEERKNEVQQQKNQIEQEEKLRELTGAQADI
jgi:membrane-associated protease RseP (regulator of RpoE activity)